MNIFFLLRNIKYYSCFFFHNFRLIDFEMKFKFNLIYFVWVHKIQPDTSFIDKRLRKELRKKIEVKKLKLLGVLGLCMIISLNKQTKKLQTEKNSMVIVFVANSLNELKRQSRNQNVGQEKFDRIKLRSKSSTLSTSPTSTNIQSSTSSKPSKPSKLSYIFLGWFRIIDYKMRMVRYKCVKLGWYGMKSPIKNKRMSISH